MTDFGSAKIDTAVERLPTALARTGPLKSAVAFVTVSAFDYTRESMNRFALFTSPHVNRVNGFRIDSRAHDMKIERLECMRMNS